MISTGDDTWYEPANIRDRETDYEARASAMIDRMDDLRKERLIAQQDAIEEEQLLQLQLKLKTE